MTERRPPVAVSANERNVFHGPLLRWYAGNARDLPWRRVEGDPYAVWVSEIMLQQTQVATVIPYFERWLRQFPTVEALAAAPLEEVLAHWAGLGYYARARNLHRAAQVVVSEYGGKMPEGPGAIEQLPGIGRYTAGAIRSIAFGQPAPLVDANVARVLSRVYAQEDDPKSTAGQHALWSIAAAIIPEDHASDFNQALMELGALICTPADPACDRCPLLPVCRAGNSPDPTLWPHIAPGRATQRVTHACIVFREAGRILLTRRPPHGLWGGLWEFPRRVCAPHETPDECARRAAREVAGVEAAVGHRFATIAHTVTHHAIRLHAFEGVIVGGAPSARDCDVVRWVNMDELTKLPLSAPQAAVVERVKERREERR